MWQPYISSWSSWYFIRWQCFVFAHSQLSPHRATFVLAAQSSSVSPYRDRRSECPTSTYLGAIAGQKSFSEWAILKKSVKLDVDHLLCQVADITSDTTTYHHHILTAVPEMNVSPFISRFLRGFLVVQIQGGSRLTPSNLIPASATCPAETSPVKAPSPDSENWWKLMKIALYDLVYHR